MRSAATAIAAGDVGSPCVRVREASGQHTTGSNAAPCTRLKPAEQNYSKTGRGWVLILPEHGQWRRITRARPVAHSHKTGQQHREPPAAQHYDHTEQSKAQSYKCTSSVLVRNAAALDAKADRSGNDPEQKLLMVEGDAGPALRTMLSRTSCGFRASQALETAEAASEMLLLLLLLLEPPACMHRTRCRAADRKLTTWCSSLLGCADAMCWYQRRREEARAQECNGFS